MTLQEILLKLARASIEEAFGKPLPYDKHVLGAKFPALREKRATFVTLRIDGKTLRGCIGSIVPHAALFDDVVANAKSAAFHDPRFGPLTESEYRRCSVEVSLLTVPQALPYSDAEDLRGKVRPDIDGVILQLDFPAAGMGRAPRFRRVFRPPRPQGRHRRERTRLPSRYFHLPGRTFRGCTA